MRMYVKQHQMCSCSCVLHTRVFCPVCINKKPENVTLLSLCWPAGADVLKCACSCICRSVCWLADVQGLGLGEEVQLALKADDEKKKMCSSSGAHSGHRLGPSANWGAGCFQ